MKWAPKPERFRPSILNLEGAGREHLLDIGDLIPRAREFKTKLDALKQQIQPRDFEWYPYDTLGSLIRMEEMLAGSARSLTHLLGGQAAIDIGCGDGILSFFLEQQGLQMTAIDFEATNHNALAGIRLLKERLSSSVEIVSLDLDSQFQLPEVHYGVAFLFGTLYHLKNPFFVLEKLAGAARYCFLSTALASHLPSEGDSLRNLPLAYLADEEEFNQDDSNYWIFTEAALRMLLKRTGWEIVHYDAVSEPSTGACDMRAFCLLRSCNDPSTITMLRGWHEPEAGGWRWTEREFSLTANLSGTRRRRLRVEFYLAPESLSRQTPLRIETTVEGEPPRLLNYRESGRHFLIIELPAAPAAERAEVTFRLSHALPPDDRDDRERGIVVGKVRVE